MARGVCQSANDQGKRPLRRENSGIVGRPGVKFALPIRSQRMPIYEFACPKCRVIYSFLSKRMNPGRMPVCPKCGNKKLTKQVSPFAALRGGKETQAGSDDPMGGGPDFDDPKVMRAMAELERDMDHLDENNPKQMARLMRKMQDALPPGSVPK